MSPIARIHCVRCLVDERADARHCTIGLADAPRCSAPLPARTHAAARAARSTSRPASCSDPITRATARAPSRACHRRRPRGPTRSSTRPPRPSPSAAALVIERAAAVPTRRTARQRGSGAVPPAEAPVDEPAAEYHCPAWLADSSAAQYHCPARLVDAPAAVASPSRRVAGEPAPPGIMRSTPRGMRLKIVPSPLDSSTVTKAAIRSMQCKPGPAGPSPSLKECPCLSPSTTVT